MTGPPLDIRFAEPAEAARAPAGMAPAWPSSRRWVWLLLAAALADVGLAFAGLNPARGYRVLIPFAVLGLYALGFAVAVRAAGADGIVLRLAALAERRWRLAAALLIGLGCAGALLAVWVLRAFPNSGDEYAYLFEARTFLAGRLWNPPPPLPALFAHYYMLVLNGKWAAAYPPGWPLLLAAVIGLRLPPWLAAPLCGGVLLLAVLKLGHQRDGALGGVLAVALVAFSAFFVFNAGSYFDVLPAAAMGLLFCWAAVNFLDHPRWSNALAAGLASGLLGLIRSQDVLLFGLPFAGQLLLRAGRRHYRLVPVVILAGLPFLADLLFYKHTLYGTLIPSVNLEFRTVRFGLFPVDEAGNHLTPFDELLYVAGRMVLLAAAARLWRRLRVRPLPAAAQFCRFHFSGLCARLPVRAVLGRQPVRAAVLFRGVSAARIDGGLGPRPAAAGFPAFAMAPPCRRITGRAWGGLSCRNGRYRAVSARGRRPAHGPLRPGAGEKPARCRRRGPLPDRKNFTDVDARSDPERDRCRRLGPLCSEHSRPARAAAPAPAGSAVLRL